MKPGYKLILLGIAIGIGHHYHIKEIEKAIDRSFKRNTPQVSCNECHRHMAYTDYFRRKGNPTPEKMAEAVIKSKNPRLNAAIAVAGEKNTPYWVRNGGYKKRHAGAWQVNPKDWGPVPTEPIGQARQVDDILEDLLRTHKGNIRKSLSNYGGDSTDKYQKKVLAELVRVP